MISLFLYKYNYRWDKTCKIRVKLKIYEKKFKNLYTRTYNNFK